MRKTQLLLELKRFPALLFFETLRVLPKPDSRRVQRCCFVLYQERVNFLHFPLLRYNIPTVIDKSEERGVAKPTLKRLAPGILLNSQVAGTLIKKAAIRLLTMLNLVCPHPLKKPLRQNTKHTRMQSMLKDLRYCEVVPISSAFGVKIFITECGEICRRAKDATPNIRVTVIPT